MVRFMHSGSTIQVRNGSGEARVVSQAKEVGDGWGSVFDPVHCSGGFDIPYGVYAVRMKKERV